MSCCICEKGFGSGESARNSGGVAYHQECAQTLEGCATCRRPFGLQLSIGEKAGETYKCIYCVAKAKEITNVVMKPPSPVSVDEVTGSGWGGCLPPDSSVY